MYGHCQICWHWDSLTVIHLFGVDVHMCTRCERATKITVR